MAAEEVPTLDLIAKAQDDFLAAAAHRTPGSLPLAEATARSLTFRDTHHIRHVRIIAPLQDLIQEIASSNRESTARTLGGILRDIIADPDVVLDNLDILHGIAARTDPDPRYFEYQLNPEVFVPLALLANRYQVTSSNMAEFAVTHTYSHSR